MLTLHKVKSQVSPGVGTSPGSRIDQKLLRCLAVSCADETYWPYPYASRATEPSSVAREAVLSFDRIVASTVLQNIALACGRI